MMQKKQKRKGQPGQLVAPDNPYIPHGAYGKGGTSGQVSDMLKDAYMPVKRAMDAVEPSEPPVDDLERKAQEKAQEQERARNRKKKSMFWPIF